MPTDPESPKILARVTNEIESTAITTAMAACGIMASTTGEFTAGFRAEAPGSINIVVRQEDFASAKEALAEFKRDRNDIDWSQIDVGEPEEI